MLSCNIEEEKLSSKSDNKAKIVQNKETDTKPSDVKPPDKSIIDLLLESDSVIVISHEGFDFKGKDSLKTVKEGVKLNSTQRKILQTLLETKVSDDRREIKDCFNPHHKVYFYTKQGMAWWWICFQCGNQKVENLTFKGVKYGDISQKSQLALLFKKYGLTYQL
jgi:hypothetical protein